MMTDGHQQARGQERGGLATRREAVEECAPALFASVCIATARRGPQLRACLESLRGQEDAPAFEVLVCSTGDPQVVGTVRAVFPQAGVVVTGAEVLPGAARNFLLERARGQWLVFLDDDVTVRPDFVRRLANLAADHPDVAVLGGPNETPVASTRFQVVQGAVLASRLGAGPVRGRYGSRAAGPADETCLTLCNLAVRRDAMVPFSVDLTCAEENEVLDQLRRESRAMWYDPGLVAFHERRGTLGEFARQMHKYGRGRGELTRRRPTSVRPMLLIPAAFVACVLIAVVLAALVAPLLLAPLGAYLCAVAAASARAARETRSVAGALLAALLFAVVHVCYGVGIWRGLVTLRRRSARPAVWLGTPAPAGAKV